MATKITGCIRYLVTGVTTTTVAAFWYRQHRTSPLQSACNFQCDDYQRAYWDHNWDQRQQCSCCILDDKDAPTAIRHIILIRPGQQDTDGKLTSLGKEQMILAALRLKQLRVPLKRIVHSNQTNAKQSADILGQQLSVTKIDQNTLLAEGAPYEPEPESDRWKPASWSLFVDSARLEAAFRRYFSRARMDQTEDSYEVIICHGNVLRYFLCRALQLPPEAWLRFSAKNGSMTWIAINGKGLVTAQCVCDAGYIPKEKLTIK